MVVLTLFKSRSVLPEPGAQAALMLLGLAAEHDPLFPALWGMFRASTFMLIPTEIKKLKSMRVFIVTRFNFYYQKFKIAPIRIILGRAKLLGLLTLAVYKSAKASGST